jgi:hypothetical protein
LEEVVLLFSLGRLLCENLDMILHFFGSEGVSIIKETRPLKSGLNTFK